MVGYLHFSRDKNGNAKLLKIDSKHPNSNPLKPNLTKKIQKPKKKTAAKKAPKPRKNYNEKYVWLLKQLKDKNDEELNLQRSSALLENILNNLRDRLSLNDYDLVRFLEKVKTDMNLKDIMLYFKVRRRGAK